LQHGFRGALNTVLPALEERHWNVIVSPKGNFIASDDPVLLDGPSGEDVGFRSAEIILFPVNRYLLLCSTKIRCRSPRTTYKLIALFNRFVMIKGNKVYSHAPDFPSLDEADKCQDDWNQFDKKKITESTPNSFIEFQSI
jgi:hypothetical protein